MVPYWLSPSPLVVYFQEEAPSLDNASSVHITSFHRLSTNQRDWSLHVNVDGSIVPEYGCWSRSLSSSKAMDTGKDIAMNDPLNLEP